MKTQRRVGLTKPKQPLHPNRADAVLPSSPRPPSPVRVTASSAAAAPTSKRRRSLSPSASPSPPRVSPTFDLLLSSELDGSSPTVRSILLLSSSPPPWDSVGTANISHTSTSFPLPDPPRPSRPPSPIHQLETTAPTIPTQRLFRTLWYPLHLQSRAYGRLQRWWSTARLGKSTCGVGPSATGS
jgi:hypothetical protein